MNRSFRQKVSGKILELTDVINKINLTDIYRTSLPSTKEYTFFSAPHETFSKIDHMLRQKTILSRYKETERIPCILSDNHRLKLDANNKKSNIKLKISWKLNNSALNNKIGKEK